VIPPTFSVWAMNPIFKRDDKGGVLQPFRAGPVDHPE
jgi:hypothetical protein